MHRRTRVLAAVLCAAASLLAGPAAANAKTMNLLILGDSYSSGNGAGNYSDITCGRSRTVWGELYATTMRSRGLTVNVKNAACGGATVVGGIAGNTVIPPVSKQVEQITSETDLVVVTIGGNDVGFANIVVQCFIPGTADPSRCRQAVSSGKNAVPRVTQQAIDVMRSARSRLRPGARVAVVSYPYLSNTSQYTLRGLFDAFRPGPAVRQLGDMGDQAITTAANTINAEAGQNIVQFIPSKDLFVGHEPDPDPFKENASSWIHETLISGIPLLETYHPKPAGQQALAAALLRAGGATGDFGVSR